VDVVESDRLITVMTPQCDREAKRGDFKLYGRACDVTRSELREAYGRTIFAAIGWRPDEPYPLWSLDVESAAYISFGEKHRLLLWSAAEGMRQLRHPDDAG